MFALVPAERLHSHKLSWTTIIDVIDYLYRLEGRLDLATSLMQILRRVSGSIQHAHHQFIQD